MLKVTVTCQECRKEFEVHPSRIKRGGGKYCSKKCQGKAYSKIYVGEKNPSWKGGKITRICVECGKEFKKTPGYIKFGGGKFCSIACKGKWHSENRVGDKSTSWKGGKITRICVECGKEFKKFPSDIKDRQGKYCSKACMIKALSAYKTRICDVCRKEFKTKEQTQKYCSRTCMGKAQSKIYIGEKHHNWRGGSSFEPYCPKFNPPFKERVRGWFNNQCVECGQPTSKIKLIVHHVYYNKKACCEQNENGEYIYNIDKEQIKVIGNPNKFVALCARCHAKTNKNRVYWARYFEDIINNWYDGRSWVD